MSTPAAFSIGERPGYAQNKLFLSVKRTEWSQTQFSRHRIMNDEQRRTEAISDFFDEEATDLPNSLCLHVVPVDSNNEVAATRIKKRKKNDYPSTIAVTLGEQINESDFSAGLGDKFLIQWLRRALSGKLLVLRFVYLIFMDRY